MKTKIKLCSSYYQSKLILNKWVFRFDLKVLSVSTLKQWVNSFLEGCSRLVEHKNWMLGSYSGVDLNQKTWRVYNKRSLMCFGAKLFSDLITNTIILMSTHWAGVSQCKYSKTRVMPSIVQILESNRAAVFWIRCSYLDWFILMKVNYVIVRFLVTYCC